MVLSEIVTRLEKRPFPEILKARIFKPLGMFASAITDETTEGHIDHRAVSYSGAPDFEEEDVNVCNYNYGDTGIFSSLDDYSKWVLALSSGSLFSAEFQKKLWSKAKTNSGKEVGYGYGWEIYQTPDGFPIIEHGGAWLGYRAMSMYLPSKGIWFTVFSNCSDFNEAEIERAYLEVLRGFDDQTQPTM